MLTEDHRKQRIGLITSSRSPAILGLSPYATAEDVMREMVREYHGLPPEFTGNAATEHGNKYEAEAIAAFELATLTETETAPFRVHAQHSFLGDSADALVNDTRGYRQTVLEVKCPYSGKLQTIAERPDYEAQCRHHAAVWDMPMCWYICYTPEVHVIEEVRAKPGSWREETLPKLRSFHRRFCNIVADPKESASYLEDKIADMVGNPAWVEAESRYESALSTHNDAKEILDAARAHLLELAEAQGKACVGSRYRVSPVPGRQIVDYKRAVADAGMEDLEQYTRTGAASWRVTEVKS